jgi:hypothetical protein
MTPAEPTGQRDRAGELERAQRAEWFRKTNPEYYAEKLEAAEIGLAAVRDHDAPVDSVHHRIDCATLLAEYARRGAALARAQTVVAAARALVAYVDPIPRAWKDTAFEALDQCERTPDLWDALAREVHKLDSDGGEQ